MKILAAAGRKWEMLAADRTVEKSEQEHVRPFLHKTNNQEVSASFTL